MTYYLVVHTGHEVGALTFEVTDNFGSNDVLPCGSIRATKLERLLSKSLTTLEVMTYYLVVHTGHEVGALTFEVTDNDVLPCGAYGPWALRKPMTQLCCKGTRKQQDTTFIVLLGCSKAARHL